MASCQYSSVTTTPQTPSVGYRTLAFEDPSRLAWDGIGPRPIVTRVWYPTAKSQSEELLQVPPDNPIFVGGLAVIGGEPLHSASLRPLIVISHGTGG
ncbi:MAG: hypothetical protein AAFV54_14185, partial [Pseudomonadota bacterium]